ncbi:poly-glutamine tract binding protein 1 [Brevipalpus obovatus]|uniref:poly-glutamine tract binding protein 1 n=1 Tax=Brevipalpus obovatus TaxID=246614 RepID=UPI003D9F7CB6
MPGSNLPPALLARLRRRGIVPVNPEPNVQEEEEVIAEDYDEPISKSGPVIINNLAVGCPNKYNIFHSCSDYCVKKYGLGTETPSQAVQRKYNRLLKKYPLPTNWIKVWEPGTARYYFWDMDRDEVSWYPPGHPKFKLSLPVPKLKAHLQEEEEKLKNIAQSDDDEDVSDESSESGSDNSDEEVDEEEERNRKRKAPAHFSERQDYRNKRVDHRKRNDLDPMDPASYSDTCPRGKWSDGLENERAVKSGVDSTASGSLYQARPYPSPGAVLRMNKKGG